MNARCLPRSQPRRQQQTAQPALLSPCALAGGLVVAVAGGMGQTAALHLLYALVTAGALAMLVYAAFRLRLN